MINRFEIIFEILKNSRSKNEYVKIAQGKNKIPNTILEIAKHTRNGKRDKYRSKDK